MPQAHPSVDFTPPQAPVGGGTKLGEDSSTINVPITNYQDIHNYPYTVKYFDIDVNAWGKFGPEIAAIEDYVSNYINENGLTNSASSYSEIVGNILKKMGASNNELGINKILKLSKYVQLSNRNISKDKRIKAMLDKAKKYE